MAFDLSRALLSALLTFFVLAFLLALFHLFAAAHRIHAEQSTEIAQLQARIAELAPSKPEPRYVSLRALPGHRDKRAAEIYGLAPALAEVELSCGNCEALTIEVALGGLLDVIERIEALVAEFSESPPGPLAYYPPSRNDLRQRWKGTLEELRQFVNAAECVDPKGEFGNYAPVRTWLEQLREETDGEGRLYQYEDKARRLTEWAAPVRITLEFRQTEDQPAPTVPAPAPPSSRESS